MQTKICVACGEEKLVTAFSISPNSSAADKLSIYCYECAKTLSEKEKVRLHTAHWRKNNAQKVEDQRMQSHLSIKYNISLDEYQQKFAAQNGLCAICGRESLIKGESGRVYALAVDHEHGTGKIRGLLCGLCNQGLGSFGEDVERLKAAIRYLEKFSSHEP